MCWLAGGAGQRNWRVSQRLGFRVHKRLAWFGLAYDDERQRVSCCCAAIAEWERESVRVCERRERAWPGTVCNASAKWGAHLSAHALSPSCCCWHFRLWIGVDVCRHPSIAAAQREGCKSRVLCVTIKAMLSTAARPCVMRCFVRVPRATEGLYPSRIPCACLAATRQVVSDWRQLNEVQMG